MKEIILLWSAEADLQNIFSGYENFQEGRGEVFFRHLDLALERLKSFPEIGPLFSQPYRKLLIPKHPYAIFYTVQPARITVTAILSLSQDPEAIRKRLGG